MYISAEKKELRRKLKRMRTEFPAERKAVCDKKISDAFLKSTTFRLTDTILCYYSVEGEVSTLEIISAALARNLNVCLPRCTKDKSGQDIMIFHRVSSLEQLKKGMYNIPEPPDTLPVFTPKGHCVCIVPGLAFDKKGYRIGYGKGYYDRFLKNFCGTKLGLCYCDFMRESVPTGKYDSKVDMIITEKGIITPDA